MMKNLDIKQYILDCAKNNVIEEDLIYYVISNQGYNNEEEITLEVLDYLKENNISIKSKEVDLNKASLRIDDSYKSYINEISQYEVLSKEEEYLLFKQIDDFKHNNNSLSIEEKISRERTKDKARERIINSNLKLVVKIAFNYMSNDIDIMDLISEGNMGLIKAIDKFDYRQGNRFSTYAFYLISGAISSFLKSSTNVRLPQNIQKELSLVTKALKALRYSNNSMNVSSKDISKYLDYRLSSERIDYLLTINNFSVSLDNNVTNEDGTKIIDTIKDTNESKDTKTIESCKGWNKLKDQEKIVLKLFSEGKNTLEIANTLNLSKSRIRQIKYSAQDKLKYYES